jgi:protein associated with RNAse G/E
MYSARLESFKYPRQPRYFYPVSVVQDERDQLMLYNPPGVPIYVGKHDRIVPASDHTLSILWPDRYYNVLLFWLPDWTFRGYYVNLALPSEWDGELCVYIDLELDVALFEDGIVRVLDQDEYEESKIRYNYPDELIERVEHTTVQVVEMMERRTFPFDGSLVSWRPNAA